MQISITAPININASEISTKAPRRSPVMPPKIFEQIFFQIMRIIINITGIIFECKLNEIKITKITAKKIS